MGPHLTFLGKARKEKTNIKDIIVSRLTVLILYVGSLFKKKVVCPFPLSITLQFLFPHCLPLFHEWAEDRVTWPRCRRTREWIEARVVRATGNGATAQTGSCPRYFVYVPFMRSNEGLTHSAYCALALFTAIFHKITFYWDLFFVWNIVLSFA